MTRMNTLATDNGTLEVVQIKLRVPTQPTLVLYVGILQVKRKASDLMISISLLLRALLENVSIYLLHVGLGMQQLVC